MSRYETLDGKLQQERLDSCFCRGHDGSIYQFITRNENDYNLVFKVFSGSIYMITSTLKGSNSSGHALAKARDRHKI